MQKFIAKIALLGVLVAGVGSAVSVSAADAKVCGKCCSGGKCCSACVGGKCAPCCK